MKSLDNFFKIMMFASGTPSHYQKIITNYNQQNVCQCTPKTAIDNGWVVRPVLNIVNGHEATNWANAVISVLHHEVKKYKNEPFITKLLANFNAIDYIDKFVSLPYIQSHIGEEFHLITIHSMKTVAEDNARRKIDCWIDKQQVSSGDSYEAIQRLDIPLGVETTDEDGNKLRYPFNDELPVIVCQVDMIGEGIDVKSFNAVLTASSSDKKIMQQTGRAMRQYYLGEHDKVHHGHCNLYVLLDNIDSVRNVLDNLAEYDLTDDCFAWGMKIDLNKGSSPKTTENEDDVAEESEPEWDDINPNDLEIKAATTKLDQKWTKEAIKEFSEYNFNYTKKDAQDLTDELKKEAIWDFFSDKGKKTVEKVLCEQSVDMFKCMEQNPVLKNAWSKDKKVFFERILFSAYFADWYLNHITKGLDDALTRCSNRA